MTLGGKWLPPRVEFIELLQAWLRLLVRRNTARFRFLAAGQAFCAALLNGGTTALVLRATLQTLFAASELGIGHTAGTLRTTAGEFE